MGDTSGFIGCHYWFAGRGSSEDGIMAQGLVRLSGLAGILAGLAWFLGYTGFTKLLLPAISQLGGHVVLGLAGLLSLLALVGLFALDATRTAPLGKGGHVLAFVGAAVFSAGTWIEGVWLAEFGVRLFALGIVALMIGMLLLGFSILRAKALPPWTVWPLIAGWATFLPMASVPGVFGLVPDATNTHGMGYVVWALSSAGLLSVGWVTLGYALWSERYTSAQQPARVR
jgi:hypothetical protein